MRFVAQGSFCYFLPHNESDVTFAFTGLWRRAAGVHSNAGTDVKHRRRLLGNGLARTLPCHSHDHQVDGTQSGTVFRAIFFHELRSNQGIEVCHEMPKDSRTKSSADKRRAKSLHALVVGKQRSMNEFVRFEFWRSQAMLQLVHKRYK